MRPLPLEEDVILAAITPASTRLTKTNISPNTDPDQRLWIFQSREAPTGLWLTNYCFTELEFLPEDFEVMNFKTSCARTSWFTYTVVCCKFLLDENEEEIIGSITLVGNELKRKIRGSSERLATFKSEIERVEGLEKWFGVILTDNEKVGIKGMASIIGTKGSA